MHKCSDDCQLICDFCIFHDFYGDENGCYIDEGYCQFHKVDKDPAEACNEFYCFNAESALEARRLVTDKPRCKYKV